MPNLFSFLRYTVFGLLIVCNAIICSVAVWNLSLAQAASISVPVDPYLIFVGLSGLLTIFILIFVELARRHGVAVWVECTWAGLFLAMETIGAATVTATAPATRMCSSQTSRKFSGSCASTQVILGFSWIISVILFAYLTALLLTVLKHSRRDRSIWKRSVNNLNSSLFHSFKLPSAPNTPVLPRFVNEKPASILAPKPQRPIPPMSYSYRNGLSPDHEIEYFQPPPLPPPPAVAPQIREHFHASSFYNEAVQATLVRHPESQNNPQWQQPTFQSSSLFSNSRPSPPPLKDWPRADVMKKPLPRQTSQARTHHSQLSSPALMGAPSRPVGPRRKRTASGDMLTRPPPLDLSNISSFNGSS